MTEAPHPTLFACAARSSLCLPPRGEFTASLPGLTRQSMRQFKRVRRVSWTTGIGVQRTPFCERLCPVVTMCCRGVRQNGGANAIVPMSL
jgi:hypothetical protein